MEEQAIENAKHRAELSCKFLEIVGNVIENLSPEDLSVSDIPRMLLVSTKIERESRKNLLAYYDRKAAQTAKDTFTVEVLSPDEMRKILKEE